MNCFKISKFFLYCIPFGIAFVTPSTLFPFIVGKYVWFRTGIDLALIFFLLGLLLNKENKWYVDRLLQIIKKPLVVAVISFVVVFNIAGFLGFDPTTSFWSNFERGEGGVQILHLGLFFVLLLALFKDESDWRKMFYFSIIGALLMIAYGILAKENVSGFVGGNVANSTFWKSVQNGERFDGSIGNPAYVAAYLIYAMFYTAYLFVSSISKRTIFLKNIILIVFFVIFLSFFFLAGTRGAFLGLIAAVIALFFYLAFSSVKWRRRFLVSVLVLLVVVTGFITFKNTDFVKKIPGSRVFDISISTTTFKHRFIMWKVALDGFKQKPILGWGPENYYQVFDRYFNVAYFTPKTSFGAWFDRAHNVFLDHLVEAGILGLISYISIFIVFYWQLILKARNYAEDNAEKHGKKQESMVNDQWSMVQKALLFAVPVAHLVQGMMLFEVLSIYLNLFLFLAFAAYYFHFKNKTNP